MKLSTLFKRFCVSLSSSYCEDSDNTSSTYIDWSDFSDESQQTPERSFRLLNIRRDWNRHLDSNGQPRRFDIEHLMYLRHQVLCNRSKDVCPLCGVGNQAFTATTNQLSQVDDPMGHRRVRFDMNTELIDEDSDYEFDIASSECDSSIESSFFDTDSINESEKAIYAEGVNNNSLYFGFNSMEYVQQKETLDSRLYGLPIPGESSISTIETVTNAPTDDAGGLYKLPNNHIHSTEEDFGFKDLENSDIHTSGISDNLESDQRIHTTLDPTNGIFFNCMNKIEFIGDCCQTSSVKGKTAPNAVSTPDNENISFTNTECGDMRLISNSHLSCSNVDEEDDYIGNSIFEYSTIYLSYLKNVKIPPSTGSEENLWLAHYQQQQRSKQEELHKLKEGKEEKQRHGFFVNSASQNNIIITQT
ncbi:hypothetical protein H4219_005840 [Mycoemilia scoparia]|uniref:Uncharacterized protein n=1 Tax=Mycoemilia scoparia TaxID=417184 RepID=A0A9W8DJ22_9FUNG|nr:hypothetical protein H4219_005840 [Mycoemilia scoparia]